MEIKINFNQLFSSNNNELNTTQETPSTPAEQSFQSLNSSFESQLSLDPNLFQPQPPSSSPHPTPPESVHSDTSSMTPKNKKSIAGSNSFHSPLPG